MDKSLVSMWVSMEDRDWIKVEAATKKRAMWEIINDMRRAYESK